ncbi:MAG: cellobiose phosphorylase [Candidatus Omnitrophica bacterium]|nr:cellobiose phosphorylase [Candidatus Omnitrophota bacterium]
MSIWKIKDKEEGSFYVENPHHYSGIYFPLTNTQGKIFSWISPFLSGDIKTSFNNYLTYPATIFDIKNPFSVRSLWLYFSPDKVLNLSPLWPTSDKIILEAGPLWSKIIRENKEEKILIEIINFVPENTPLEIIWVKITNKDSKPKSFIPISSIPLFCRSANNIFDHRHVTSLLNRAFISRKGIIVKPTLIFDEKGHQENKTSYFVFGFTDQSNLLLGVFSNLEEFTGRGNLFYPESVFSNKKPQIKKTEAGKENFAGLKFKRQSLNPQETLNLFLIMGITEANPYKIVKNLNTPQKIIKAFQESKDAWAKLFKRINIDTKDNKFDFWINWVGLQPILRKLFGCSFLAHFDYGKGGRGFRDLWQDLLNLTITSPQDIKKELINNFRSLRIDGSNATIITKEGNFISDRNKISRVWSDHGVWPFLTLKPYLDRTGDYKILFSKVEFFRDHQLKRAQEVDINFLKEEKPDYFLRDKSGKIYKSTILDHLLIQNLVPFFNVGKKGNIKLENADWNDALDMAEKWGETVAFSCMYTKNIKDLADLLEYLLKEKNIKKIELTKEVRILLDTLSSKINYNNPQEKRKLLEKYLEKTKTAVEGKAVEIDTASLIKDLRRKANWFKEHIEKKEWLRELGFFNGYYDNSSSKVEGEIKNKIRLLLPSQAFAIMSGIFSKTRTKKIWVAISNYLKEKGLYAFRLNTDFKELKLNLGRAFGFSYGDKENGSVFSHMNVMLAYGLYKQNFVKEGYKIINSLFKLATHSKSQILPCIPEYFNSEHKGLYPYLTGSASWLIYLLITEVFGIKFRQGKFIIEPKFVKEQFKEKTISLQINLQEKKVKIIYLNPEKKDWPAYSIRKIRINGKLISFPYPLRKIEFPLSSLSRLLNLSNNTLEVEIG